MRHLIITVTVVISTTSAAFGGDFTTSDVMTHPSQGDVSVVEGVDSHFVATPDGVFVHFESGSLKPGNTHAMWFVTIANPSACATSPCFGKDVLKNTDAVIADANYAGGAAADDTGIASFATNQEVGAQKKGWLGHGFSGASTSEIHLVIKDHGPLIDSRASEMLGTFRDGCTDASFSKAFFSVAVTDGATGPNTCTMVQFSVFTTPQQQS